MEEYVKRLNVAQAHFDWATDPEEVDVAIYELQAAELAMSRYVKSLKKEEELSLSEVKERGTES